MNWLELACHSAACAPPPTGTGGSSPEGGGKMKVAGGDHAVGVSSDPNSQSLKVAVKRQPGESAQHFHERVFEVGQEKYHPAQHLEDACANFRKENGLPEPKVGSEWTDIEAPWSRAVLVGTAFSQLQSNPNDPRVKKAYGDLVEQTKKQWSLLTRPESEGGLGIKVDFVTPEDIARDYGDKEGLNPYQTAEEQMRDLVENKHLAIATTSSYPEAYHPLLGNEQGGTYDVFRAVHDAFGHAAIGADFTRHGEYQAWLHHVSMFSGDAALAASTELTGENSYLFTRGLPATHKAALLNIPGISDPWDKDGHYQPTTIPVVASGAPVMGGDPEVVEKWGIVKSMDVLMAKAKGKQDRAGMTASLWISEALDAVAS